jgi:excisionase family DNA binding protein
LKVTYTVKEVAEYIGVPIRYVRQTIRENSGVGYAVHEDGHWQRRIWVEQIPAIRFYCNVILKAGKAVA